MYFFNIALHAAKNGVTMRSGGATGADLIAEYAYERAINVYNASKNLVEIFHPWKSFGKGNPLHELYIKPESFSEQEIILSTVLDEAHFNRMKNAEKKGGLLLHCRNVNQILGKNLNDPVDAVVCWTESGKPTGGTRTAILLAESRNIPAFNTRFYKKKDYLNLLEAIETGEF